MDRIAIIMLIMGNLVSLLGELVSWRSKGTRAKGYYMCKVMAAILIGLAAVVYFVW